MKLAGKFISLILILMIPIIILNNCAGTKPKPVGALDKNQVVEKYFKNRSLDEIEGIWVREDNSFEIAIIASKYLIVRQESLNILKNDYVGVVTDTKNKDWEIGETKLLIKKTGKKGVYIASYFDDQAKITKSQKGYTLTIKNDNEAIFNESVGRMRLIKTYPIMNSKGVPDELPDSSKSVPSKYEDLLNCVVVVRNSSGLGTGFIITADGYIITNQHVVDRDKTVSIKLRNGKTIFGDVLSTDNERDLALIKVDGSNYPWLTLGGLTDSRVGDDVIAVGTPQGWEWSVSKGIVSAIRRFEPDIVYIQTDAAINHGNSGGPLISIKNGKVMGVNRWTEGKSIGELVEKGYIAEGLNFAVSAEEIVKTFPLLKK